jgi:hypothetical protein
MESNNMTKPIVRIYTTVDEFIDREMNADEFAQYKKDKAESDARQAEAEAKAQAKAELLERLGITADEAKLLLA